MPSIEQVLCALVRANESIEPSDDEDGDEAWCDVRLQVWPDGSWTVHTGDASYDQDHRGKWGAACVPGRGRLTDSNAEEIAKDLLRQVEEQ